MPSSSPFRRPLVAGVALALSIGTAAVAAPAVADDSPPKTAPADTLGSHDATLLAEAEAAGEPQVTLMVTTDRGRTADVARAVDDLGGTVSARFDKVGYLQVSMPTSQVRKAARTSGVDAIDLDEVVERPDPAEGTARDGLGAAAATGPGASTPDANPFMPTDETGAVDFKEAHPEWDGRGTTIGILDSGVDLDHPALATTSTGERKIVDWVTATDPVTEGDGTWRRMNTTVTGPSFSAAGRTWFAPAGEFRFNVFSESVTTASEPAGDLNRDGDTRDQWGVLYRPSDGAVWVDVDQNGDFTDETLMRNYRQGFQVGHFGADKPGTALVEQTPFVVETRKDVDLTPLGGSFVGQRSDYVNIGIVESAHGSHVAGITAANAMFGGEMDGAAPGAKIVSSRACSWGGGCTAAALTTGMADLVANRGVDVVNMSIGGLPPLNDGNTARATLYNRLIADYGVQLFISAGNSGPGENTVGDPSVATDVVSVAAAVSKETWKSNYGATVRRDQDLFPFSSRGPREDGGFKPNVSAPGSAISTVPQWIKQPDVAEAGYTLPIGYAMFNGTSMASPQAAGVASLLLSAGFATDRGTTPAQMRRALYSTATFVEGVSAVGQGNGLVDVDKAWDMLSTGSVQPRRYTVSAPVCSVLSEQLATPNRGTGIRNRCGVGQGGQRAGQARTYPVRVTRTSGAAGDVRHRVTWVGNDGTWSSARTVDLPLNRAVTVDVTATPQGEGRHDAIMRLDDPRTTGVDTEVMNTVIAASQPRRPSYATSWSGTVDRANTTSHYVNVPEGATALQLKLSGIATGSQTRMIAINPQGLPFDPTASSACFTNFSDRTVCDPTSRTIEDPTPGVWEIEVEARRTTPVLENPYEVSTTTLGVQVEPETVELASVQAGTPTPVSWELTNLFAPVTVRGEGGPLGSAHEERATIADGASESFEVTVPAGASEMEATIGNTSDAAADLDLTVLRDGVVVGQDADGDSEESVVIANPAAGTYTVVVDGYEVPAGTTEYDYLDVFTASSLGEVTASSEAIELPAGGTATLEGEVVANAGPGEGRTLRGAVDLVSDDGAVVGRGAVEIAAVS